MQPQAPSLSAPSLSAIVLAGGRSSRMGEDKALISIDGVPLLRRVCLTAQSCTDQIYLVSPWGERYQSALSEIPVTILPEIQPADSAPGPLRGFAQALSQIRPADWLLLLACDLPNLQPAILQQWITLLPNLPPNTLALLPQNPAGWWEPLCGFYRVEVAAELEQYLATGGSSFQGWLKQIAVAPLPYESEMLFNCNQPADLQAMRDQSL
jgi:molybdopterin-guanine dinucleotide biosynthesis protein A